MEYECAIPSASFCVVRYNCRRFHRRCSFHHEFLNYRWHSKDIVQLAISGEAVKNDLDMKMSKSIVRTLLSLLLYLANSAVQIIDPDDKLFILRIKTKKNEAFMSYDEKFTLISISMRPVESNAPSQNKNWVYYTLHLANPFISCQQFQGLEYFFFCSSFKAQLFIASACRSE